jgi:hypothetical protein
MLTWAAVLTDAEKLVLTVATLRMIIEFERMDPAQSYEVRCHDMADAARATLKNLGIDP